MVDQVSITLSPGVCTNTALNTLHNYICNSHRFHRIAARQMHHIQTEILSLKWNLPSWLEISFIHLTAFVFLFWPSRPFFQSTKIQQYHFDRPYTFIQFCFDWIFFLFCSRLHISTRICSADCKYFGRCWQRCDIYLSRTTFRWISSK